jgi:DNA-binding response OmpR family regulator
MLLMTKILVVEDEPALQETLSYSLTRQGYTVNVAGDGRSAVEVARKFLPDLIILDVMLPEMDGFEVCRILRQEMNVIIIMLTARDEEIDRVLGLEIGADDYITKPFSMRELLVRVKAHLRHERRIREDLTVQDSMDTKDILVFDNLEINLVRREALLDHEPLPLKPKEYDLLLHLARHRGKALSRDSLLAQVWGWEYGGGTRTVDVHIHWLRKKIEKDAANPTRIITVQGSGYRFEG